MRLRIPGCIAVAAITIFCGLKILDDDGVVGQTKKPLRVPVFQVKGCFCHGDSATPRVHVWISGPDTLRAGTRGLYTINVAKDTSKGAGFDVAAWYGDLGVYDSVGTQLMRIDVNNPYDSLELTHTMTRAAHGRDTISWSFWYKAPNRIGAIDTIYASGNSVDTSLDPSGDYWNFAPNFLVHVTGPSSVGAPQTGRSFELRQNYPNPFNPSTTITYTLSSSSVVTLRVFNTAGQLVSTLVDDRQSAGSYRYEWNAAGLASGVYLVKLSTAEAVQVRKALLLR